jgi:hypothetical protein
MATLQDKDVSECVPVYRVEFFVRLYAALHQGGINLTVPAGTPHPAQRQGDDRCSGNSLPCLQLMCSWEWRFSGRPVVARGFRKAIRHADLIIFERVRRNIDAYLSLL